MQPKSDTSAFRNSLNRWFKKNARILPWRGITDPYRILVSEIMLQQTQVATVLGYYERWLARFPDIRTLAAAEESDVLHAWQGLGYYSRARNLHRTAKTVMESHNGVFPRKLDDIRSLPGVGRYTAGAIATFAYDQSTPIVDANIARVLARLFAIRVPIDTTAGSNAIWSAAESLIPKRNAGRYNAALMELGALVCSPRTPDCARCPVRRFCSAEDPGRLPIKKPRRKTVHVEESAAFVHRRGKILLALETGTRWRGLWRLPPLPDADPEKHRVLTRLKYPITHHLVTLTVFNATAADVKGKWIPIQEAGDMPMPSPHRKAFNAILADESVLRRPA